MIPNLGRSLGTDYYMADKLLDDEEIAIRDRVRSFSDSEVLPVINDYWERAEFPVTIAKKMADLEIAGGNIEGYGCPGMSAVAHGLVMMELARGDGSISTFFGVHSGLAMKTIGMLGSREQKERYLPAMARMEKVGAFALTEPNHGSDAVMLETRARRDGGGYVIDGAKRWIGNASFADVIIVWARDDAGEIGAFVVEKGAPGFETEIMSRKSSLRAVWQTNIKLNGVRVHAEDRLAEAKSFRDTTRVLTAARDGVAWDALGHAVAAYECALEYAGERVSFGRRLTEFQLVQEKLARMLAEITSMQLLCIRLSRLADEGDMTAGMASLAKMNNGAKARDVIADARDILGGNGILLDFHVARHHADIESVFTFEGTDSIQALVVGRDITGIQAFSAQRAAEPKVAPPDPPAE